MADEGLHARKLALIREWALPEYDGGMVIDVGGGDKGFRRRGDYHPGGLFPPYKYKSLDILQEHGVHICADAHFLPLVEGGVGLILCTNALEHMEDPRAVVKECLRVLCPGCCMFLMAPEIEPRHESPVDLHRFSLADLWWLMRGAGFEVEAVGSPPPYEWRGVMCKRNWALGRRPE